ncbi:hypothetical protein ACLEUK_22530 [Pseudescherichia vulneris]
MCEPGSISISFAGKCEADGEGKTTRYLYGAFDLLLGLTRPDGKTLGFAYDSLTRLTQVTCAGGETYRLERDAAGQAAGITGPPGANDALQP